MIDLVTVVFRDELPVLKLQAESIDLYCQGIGVNNIYVVVNDSVDVADAVDPSWWGTLGERVKVIHRDYFNCQFVDNGWVSQQALKLLASALSTNQYSMVLDAKTIFVQPVELNQLFDNQHRITFGYFPIAEVFYPAREITNRLFNIDLVEYAGPGGVPHLFNTKLLIGMIDYITKLTGENFAEWFQDQGRLTEFVLYSGYVQYHYGSLDYAYSTYSRHYRVCNICHSEVDQFDRKILDMSQPDILTVSIHRNCWKQLTNTQQLEYVRLLKSRGITRAESLL